MHEGFWKARYRRRRRAGGDVLQQRRLPGRRAGIPRKASSEFPRPIKVHRSALSRVMEILKQSRLFASVQNDGKRETKKMPNLQEERSAETRRRLMDATVACLYERGYAGTTTVEIAARAGVSRGAQLHHFPTKNELVVSALEFVFDLRAEEVRTLSTELPAGSPINRLE